MAPLKMHTSLMTGAAPLLLRSQRHLGKDTEPCVISSATHLRAMSKIGLNGNVKP